jgi:hypothetical protein
MGEWLARTDDMHAGDQPTQPLQLFNRFQRWRAAAAARCQCIAETFAPQQGVAVKREWRNHGQFRCGQLLRKRMFLDNRRVAPATGPIELRDHRCSFLQPYLPHAVFVTVECQQAAVRP